jgi:5-methyltetrahydrofolate--homocysteine methyltransferase
MNLLERLLNTRDVVIADGAMGTNLFLRGLGKDDVGAAWNVQRPEVVAGIHRGFVEAGADVLLTNTFGANRFRLAFRQLESRTREFNVAATRIAREVAERAGRPVVVAGNIGPIGEVLEPLGTRGVDEAEQGFFEQATALREAGVDIAWIESMFADDELDAAVRAVQRAGLAYVATMIFDTNGRTMMGVRPEDAMRRSGTFAHRPIAFGANCGVGPAQLMDSVLGLIAGAEPGAVVVAKSNCGIPVLDADLRVRYDGTPDVLARYACMARDAGARIIGGCCGATDEHLRRIVEALASTPRQPPPTRADIELRLGGLGSAAGVRSRT